MKNEKMCKWITVRKILGKDIDGKTILGKPFNVSEHNEYFEWYQTNQSYKVVRRFERPCTKRKCKIHKGD